MNDSSSKHLIALVGLSTGILLLLSAVPWSSLTGNVIKDFNLFEDLLTSSPTELMAEPGPLAEELDLHSENNSLNSGNGSGNAMTAMTDSACVDSITKLAENCDSLKSDSALTAQKPLEIPVCAEAPRHDDMVLIENYTDGPLLPRFKAAVAQAASRPVRIAVLGDSYIEGDIFVQNLRAALQQRWGGCGIGFTPAHSEFPGFRQSVRLSSKGWKLHDIRTMARRDSLRLLSSDYCSAAQPSSSSFKGSKSLPKADRWERSTFVFIAPQGGTVTLTADNGLTADITAEASPRPQALVLDGPTASLKVNADAPGLVALATFLDGSAGIQVDCMSVRGNMGLVLSRINSDLSHAMRQWADYDLIIFEFGMNAISPGQTNYNAYGQGMAKAVNAVSRAYPAADILIMGVGDRAGKSTGTLRSMPECAGMVNAQRKLASRTHSFFWDTRAAMGGDGAAQEWRKRRLLNADYIHLNHDGGAELARLFDYALSHAIDN